VGHGAVVDCEGRLRDDAQTAAETSPAGGCLHQRGGGIHSASPLPRGGEGLVSLERAWRWPLFRAGGGNKTTGHGKSEQAKRQQAVHLFPACHWPAGRFAARVHCRTGRPAPAASAPARSVPAALVRHSGLAGWGAAATGAVTAYKKDPSSPSPTPCPQHHHHSDSPRARGPSACSLARSPFNFQRRSPASSAVSASTSPQSPRPTPE
jgi:hypothetical protein